MKSFKFYLNLLLVLVVSLFVSGKVMAATYDVNIIPVNVTDSCDLSDETGMENCYFDYLDGNLDSNIITDSLASPGMKIMNIISVVPSSGSVLTGIKVTVENDSTMTTGLGVYGVAGPDGASYGFFPKKGRNTTWTTSTSHPTATSYILIADKGDNVDYPLVEEAPMWATFYEVNSTPATNKDVVFSFNKTKSASNASDSDANDLELSLHDVSLSIPSSESNDASFSSLTATGTNSSDNTISRVYPFGFVSGDDSVTTYSFIVPNDVDQITFTGTTTDSNPKVVTGLNTPISLNVGNNTISNVTVVPESGSKTVIYQFNIKRLSNDTSLKTVSATNSVNYGSVADINTNSGASITVPYKTTSTTPTIVANHDDASVSYNSTWSFNTDDLTNVKTTENVVVSAEDCSYTASAVPGNKCTTKTYKFETTRTAPSKNVNLSGITVDGVAITPFDTTGATTTYTLTPVDYTTTSINIQATLADSLNKIASGTGVKTVNVGDNTYNIVVNSEDCESGPTSICTTKTYTVKLHQKSHESLLDTLNVTSTPAKSLTPSFSPSYDATSGEYTYSYDPSSSQVTVSATAKDATNAYISIIDMSSSEAIDNSVKTLGSDSKTFPITTTKVGVIVTAEDDTTRVYKINIEREKSIDASLKALSINPGTITTSFNPSTLTYNATVGPEVTSTTVTATPTDDNAEVTSITGDSGFSFGSGNTITVVVKAEAGNTENYRINVTRELYKDATLDDLRVGIGSATPTTVTGFPNASGEYTISTESSPIPYATNSIVIEADEANSYATITGQTGTQTLSTGDNTFTITVTAQDTSVTKTYKIHAYRAKNDDNIPTGITVKGVSATPTSDPQVYEVTLPNSVDSIAQSDVVISIPAGATLNKPTATMNLVTTSTNVYNYTITSESGVAQTYTINITREKSSNANISRINAYVDGEATSSRYCTMTDSDNSCRIEVPVGTSTYRLEAVLAEGATVSPDNSTEYTMGTSASDSIQTRNLTVTAEDATTTKGYTITVERTKSSNANLSSITITDVTNPSSPSVIDLPSACYDASSELTQTCNIAINGNVNDITINAEKVDSKATIVTALPITATLPFGLTTKTIEVQAENTAITKTYTINLTKAYSSDVTLEDLQVSSSQISGFAPANTSYVYTNQSYSTTNLDVYAKANDANAKITKLAVIDKDNVEHEVTITQAREVTSNVTLSTGLNKIVFTVTAQDNTTKETYEIQVTRAQNNSTAINEINVAGVNAIKDSSDDYKYTVTVPNSVDEANATNVTVTVADGELPTDAKATYSVPTLALATLNADSTPVENTLVIPVTAEDGTTDNYTVIITRTPNDVATLNRVNLYEGTNTSVDNYCVFTGTDTSCTISLGETATAFTLEGILDDANSKVEFTSGTENNPFTLALGETSKVVTATVTAEDTTTTKEYTINISRTKSSVSILNNILVQDSTGNDIGTWNTSFNSATDEYTVTLPYATEEFYLYAVKGEANEKITGIPADNRIEFTTSPVVVNIASTSDDDSSTSNYKLTFVRYVNNNANLEKLVPSVGNLTPAFAQTTTSYQVSVSNETTSISLTTKADDEDAMVSTNGTDYFKTNEADHVFEYNNLVVGNNNVVIYVKSTDNTIKEYNVNIIRQVPEASDENKLAGLTVSSSAKTYSLTPAFSSGTTNYEIKEVIPFELESLTITATKNHSLETLRYYVDGVLQSSNVVNIPKVKGTKTITVQVEAENGDINNYVIKYTKNPSSNAYLSSIVDSTAKITSFVKETLTYEINVDSTINDVTLNLTADDAKSKIAVGTQEGTSTLVYTKSGLVEGRNEIAIVVTAEDGTTLTYNVIVNKEAEDEIITSVAYGHTIADGMIKTAKLGDTILDLKNQLDNDNSKLVVYKADGVTALSDTDKVATGQIVKLIINGTEKDSDIIVVKGDTNGDGKITLLDAVKTINHYLKKSTLVNEYLEAADTDSNGKITLLDAVKIINHYLGKTSLFS
ncbi:MAG: cadherin-like beta sandwich domain-containing protein [Bacilli bacterium]|nr:cadherin-like beta sandwich domain-containing protein [Bacilli bacterium]